MRLNMPETMKEHVLNREESVTDYINNLVECMKYYRPFSGSILFNGRYVSAHTGRAWVTFNLKESNRQTLYQIRGYKDIYASNLRLLILSDMYQKTIPQQDSPYSKYLEKVLKAEIDLDTINETCDFEYEIAEEPAEYAKKVLKKRNWTKTENSFPTIFQIPQDPIRWSRIGRSRFIPIKQRDWYNRTIPWIARLHRSGFGFVHKSSVLTSETHLDSYQREMIRGDLNLTGVCESFTGVDGGVLLKYPELLEKDFTSKDGPTLKWGEEEYYTLEGHFIPEEWFWDPDKITKKDILSTRDTERRRVLVDHIGLERFAKILELEVVDEGKYAKLLRSQEDHSVYLIQVECTSTGRQYHLGFHPRLLPHGTKPTADAALAWTFGMTEEEYKPTVET